MRIPNALNAINDKSGICIYDDCDVNDIKLHIANSNNLTQYEKYAILAMHTANVTFNSFAAEVWFHADALSDWLSIFDSYYSKALRADMAIGEEKRESGIFDQYYNPNSDMVKAQIAIHGEC